MVDDGAGLLLGVSAPAGIDLFRYAGGSWNNLPSPVSGSYPSVALARDTKRGVVVLHTDTQTFEFDGTAFAPVPVANPPKRALVAMAYDEKNQRVVLYGGVTGTTVYFDTWTYDGASWKQLTTTGAPPPRHSATMTYDAGKGRIVMYGGCTVPLCGTGPNGKLFDTWELDGGTWTKVATPVQPSSALRTQLAYDPIRDTSYLVGTEDTVIYEYDGMTYAVSSFPDAPPSAGAAAYSPSLHALAVASTTGLWTLGFR
jgi:hypothetical protein